MIHEMLPPIGGGADSGIDFTQIPEYKELTAAKNTPITFTFSSKPKLVVVRGIRTGSLNLSYIYTLVIDIKNKVAIDQTANSQPTVATTVTDITENGFTIQSYSTNYSVQWDALAYS